MGTLFMVLVCSFHFRIHFTWNFKAIFLYYPLDLPSLLSKQQKRSRGTVENETFEFGSIVRIGGCIHSHLAFLLVWSLILWIWSSSRTCEPLNWPSSAYFHQKRIKINEKECNAGLQWPFSIRKQVYSTSCIQCFQFGAFGEDVMVLVIFQSQNDPEISRHPESFCDRNNYRIYSQHWHARKKHSNSSPNSNTILGSWSEFSHWSWCLFVFEISALLLVLACLGLVRSSALEEAHTEESHGVGDNLSSIEIVKGKHLHVNFEVSSSSIFRELFWRFRFHVQFCVFFSWKHGCSSVWICRWGTQWYSEQSNE